VENGSNSYFFEEMIHYFVC